MNNLKGCRLTEDRNLINLGKYNLRKILEIYYHNNMVY